MIYLFVIFLLLFLIVYYDINEKSVNRDFWYNTVLFVFILIAGLRYRLGADTPNYLYDYYHYTHDITGLRISELSWDLEPLYKIIVSSFHSMDLPFYAFQLFHALFVNLLLFNYIKRHCHYIFTCVFFYFIWMYFFYNMEELRASMSVVVCLYSNDLILKRKWLKGYLLILVGCAFHKSTFLLLVLPLFYGLLRFNIIGIIFLTASFLISLYLKTNMAEYINLFEFSDSFSESANIYANSETYGENAGNIFFYFVHILPFVFYPLILFFIRRKYSERSSDMIFIEPLIIVGMMFVLLRSNIEIFYRYVHFYAIYIIISFAELFILIVKYKGVGFASYFRTFVVFLPLFVMIGRSYVELLPRYYPYASVIDKTLNENRERLYSDEGCARPSFNEY